MICGPGSGRAVGRPPTGRVDEILAERDIAVVSYEGWQAIDAAECAAGEPHGRPRIKLHRWDDTARRGPQAS